MLRPLSKENKAIPERKRRIVVFVGLALLAALIYFGLRFRDSGFAWRRFLSAFATVDGRWLAAAAVLLYSTYLGRALRWRVMMAPVAPRASLSNLLSATIIGFTAVTLFGRPGELVRPYLIAKKERVTFSSQAAVWVLERIYDLLIVLALFGFALTQAHDRAVAPGSWLDWIFRTGGYVVGGLACVCVGVLIAAGSFSETAQRRIREGLAALPDRYRNRIESVLLSFVGGMKSTGHRTFVLQLVLYTIAEWMLVSACNYMIFQSFPPTAHFTWVENLVFLGFVAFGSVVQVPGIGGGFQVAAVLMLTEFFGIALEPATAVAVLIWGTMYVMVVPAGLLLALSQGLKWSALRHVADTGSSQADDSGTPVRRDCE